MQPIDGRETDDVRQTVCGALMLAVLSACSSLAVLPSAAPTRSAAASRSGRASAWTLANVPSAPQSVMTTFAQEKADVLHQIQQADQLKSLTVSSELAVHEWRIDGEPVGYGLTLHGNVVFEKPGYHKTGAFIADFCIDAAGRDFGVYAFTVNSDHPETQLLPARRTRADASPLSLSRIAAKPTDIQAACSALYPTQHDALVAALPQWQIKALTDFPAAVTVRYKDTLIGYIDAQTSSALPQDDVIGIQVLNYLDPTGNKRFSEARVAGANALESFRIIGL